MFKFQYTIFHFLSPINTAYNNILPKINCYYKGHCTYTEIGLLVYSKYKPRRIWRGLVKYKFILYLLGFLAGGVASFFQVVAIKAIAIKQEMIQEI